MNVGVKGKYQADKTALSAAKRLLEEQRPANPELERAVLGSLLICPKTHKEISSFIDVNCFYEPAHQLVFDGIQNLVERNWPVDLLTVTDQLRKNGVLKKVGGAIFITRLAQGVASTANTSFHARLLQELSIKRKLIKNSETNIIEAFHPETDVFDLHERSTDAFNQLFVNGHSSITSISTPLNNIVNAKLDLKFRGKAPNGIEMGIVGLDEVLGGIKEPEFVVIASRPGMGKTAFLLHLARHNARRNKKIGIISLEMNAEQLVGRMVVAETGILNNKFKKGELTENETAVIHQKYDCINSLPIYFADNSLLDVNGLRSLCYQFRQTYKVDLIVIDYFTVA